MKKALIALCFFGLISLNALSLLNSAVHNALYGVLDGLLPSSFLADSVTNKSKAKDKALKKAKADLRKSNAKLASTRKKVTLTRNKIQRRVARNISINLGSIPAESIPVLGIATIVGVTAMDLKDACDTMSDLDELSTSISLAQDEPETDKICGKTVPSKEEVMASIGIDDGEYEDFRYNPGGFIYDLLHGE